MSAHSHWRGHPIVLDVDGETWFYADRMTLVSDDPNRACGHCGLANTSEGHDGCLGTIPGAINACCGHGNEQEAYVMYSDGREVRGGLSKP